MRTVAQLRPQLPTRTHLATELHFAARRLRHARERPANTANPKPPRAQACRPRQTPRKQTDTRDRRPASETRQSNGRTLTGQPIAVASGVLQRRSPDNPLPVSPTPGTTPRRRQPTRVPRVRRSPPAAAPCSNRQARSMTLAVASARRARKPIRTRHRRRRMATTVLRRNIDARLAARSLAPCEERSPDASSKTFQLPTAPTTDFGAASESHSISTARKRG